MRKISKELFFFFYNSSYSETNSLKKFLLRSKKNLILVLFIYANEKITLEEIIYNISSRVISRSTIQNILNNGCEIGFFTKSTSNKDRRGKNYTLTENAIDVLEEWINNQKKILKTSENLKLAC